MLIMATGFTRFRDRGIFCVFSLLAHKTNFAALSQIFFLYALKWYKNYKKCEQIKKKQEAVMYRTRRISMHIYIFIMPRYKGRCENYCC